MQTNPCCILSHFPPFLHGLLKQYSFSAKIKYKLFPLFVVVVDFLGFLFSTARWQYTIVKVSVNQVKAHLQYASMIDFEHQCEHLFHIISGLRLHLVVPSPSVNCLLPFSSNVLQKTSPVCAGCKKIH